MKHTPYRCHNCQAHHCKFCDGGLVFCTTCNGAEASLTGECPGAPMTERQELQVMKGLMDFHGGRWHGYGKLAKEYCGVKLPLQVMRSAAGFYIGTADDEGPCSRESLEYFPVQARAERALATGDWTQKEHP